MKTLRRFTLERDTDVSGISGTGTVAEGVAFTDGTCVIRWLTDRASTVVWSSVDDAIAIHGHGGSTRLVFMDEETPEPDATHIVTAIPGAGFPPIEEESGSA